MTRKMEGRFERTHAALAHPARTQIVEYLRSKDYVRAGQIAEDLAIANSTLSGHLRVLRDANLLVSRRVGTEVQYRANLSTLQDLILSLQAFLHD